MKSIKFKLYNSITLASPLAPIGETPSGAIIFQVDNIPENISTAKACMTLQGVIAPHLGKYRFDWHG